MTVLSTEMINGNLRVLRASRIRERLMDRAALFTVNRRDAELQILRDRIRRLNYLIRNPGKFGRTR